MKDEKRCEGKTSESEMEAVKNIEKNGYNVIFTALPYHYFYKSIYLSAIGTSY